MTLIYHSFIALKVTLVAHTSARTVRVCTSLDYHKCCELSTLLNNNPTYFLTHIIGYQHHFCYMSLKTYNRYNVMQYKVFVKFSHAHADKFTFHSDEKICLDIKQL